MTSELEHKKIKIGTSGWSYDDWVGPFYPSELASRKNQWLEYYGKHFDTVEINSTFYRLPNDRMVKRWVEVGSKLQGFEFSLKLPQDVTHEALVEANEDKAAEISTEFEKKVVKVLAGAELMGCILIQLSPFFRRYDKKTNVDNLDRLETLFDTVNHFDYAYVAEFRHSSWLTRNRRDLEEDTLKLLKNYNIGVSKTDGPGFPATKTDTAPHSYVRFHGRNKDIWFKGKKFEEAKKKGGAEADDRFNRYDYLYTEDELKPWVPVVKEAVVEENKKERLYFNNHPHGQAIQNAFMMMDLVGLPRKYKGVRNLKQQKLDLF